MADALTICGELYTPSFTKNGCDGPCLTLTAVGDVGSGGSAGTGTVFTGVREGCGPNWAVFAFGGPEFCTGTAACGGPAANVLRIRVSWVSCYWDGPGWYCVKDCPGTVCAAVELLDGDQYRTDIEICSGPYPNEASAQGACGTSSCSAPIAIDLDGPVTTTQSVFQQFYQFDKVDSAPVYLEVTALNNPHSGLFMSIGPMRMDDVTPCVGVDAMSPPVLYAVGCRDFTITSPGRYQVVLTYTYAGSAPDLEITFAVKSGSCPP